jgi:hypothetical protein
MHYREKSTYSRQTSYHRIDNIFPKFSIRTMSSLNYQKINNVPLNCNKKTKMTLNVFLRIKKINNLKKVCKTLPYIMIFH